MIVHSVRARMNAWLWSVGIMLSCVVSLVLVGLLVAEPCWWTACSGWILVAVNSIVLRVINERAIGVSRAAFVRWGVVLNSIRMLTLAGIFVYMTLSFQSGRSSFLIAGFSAFFFMMPFELMQLLKSQDKVVGNFECGCNTDQCR